MQLTHQYDPWSVLDRMGSDIKNEARYWQPAVDIIEEDSRYLIHADIPGVDPDAIEITADKGTLTIKAEKTLNTDVDKGAYKKLERVSGTYYRRFQIPKNADVDAIEASGKNGTLEVVLPKLAEQQVKKIVVKH